MAVLALLPTYKMVEDIKKVKKACCTIAMRRNPQEQLCHLLTVAPGRINVPCLVNAMSCRT